MPKKSENASFEKIPLQEEDSKLKRVAKFLILIGEEEGAEVLKHLPEEDIEKICREMALIERIEKEETVGILQEFGYLKEEQEEAPVGGMITARHFLEKAFGSERAEAVMEKAVPESFPGPFTFLEEVELPQMLHLIKDESPYVISLVLSHIKPSQAAEVIKTMPGDQGTDLLKRMARMGQLDKSVIEATSSSLKNKLDRQGRWQEDNLQGQTVLADILKHMDQGTEQRLLDSLGETDENLEREVRELLFTVESIEKVLDEDIQDAVQNFQDKEIALLLKGKDERFSNKILNNMSSRRSELITEDMTLMGPIRKTEVEAFTKQFLSFLKERIDQGKYRYIEDEEEYI